jgi:hypothetical protein
LQRKAGKIPAFTREHTVLSSRGWKNGETKRIPAFNYFHNCINRIHNEMISLSKDLSKAIWRV